MLPSRISSPKTSAGYLAVFSAPLTVLLALSTMALSARALAQGPATGASATYHIALQEGSNIVSLPVVPSPDAIGEVVADVPTLTLVQDDAGRYYVPIQGITDLDTWAWDKAYRVEVAAAATLSVEGPAILPEASPINIRADMGNWVPYFRSSNMAVEEALASIAANLVEVEDANGRRYRPGDDRSTLHTLRVGHGYKVWVNAPSTLLYPPNGGGGPSQFRAAAGTHDGEDYALGMRAENRFDPKGPAVSSPAFYDGISTQGERLWIGVGGTGYDYGHPLYGVEPRGGGLQAIYVNGEGGISDLPPLGETTPNRFHACHEATVVGNAGDATYFVIRDGACNPNHSYMLVDRDGVTSWDRLRINGRVWSNGAKNHAFEATDSGNLVVFHAHSSPDHGGWPAVAVNNGPEDADFYIPGASHSSDSPSAMRLGAVGDRIYLYQSKSPALAVIAEVGDDSAYVQRLVDNIETFWGSEFEVNEGGFGATARYIGPAGDQPGFVIYTGGSSRLDYWSDPATSVRPVDEETAWYKRVNGATYRVTYPGYEVQRLASLTLTEAAATPTWVTEGTLVMPSTWDFMPAHIEITDLGSVWVIGHEIEATYPPTGQTHNDISVLYFRGGQEAP